MASSSSLHRVAQGLSHMRDSLNNAIALATPPVGEESPETSTLIESFALSKECACLYMELAETCVALARNGERLARLECRIMEVDKEMARTKLLLGNMRGMLLGVTTAFVFLSFQFLLYEKQE